MDYLLTITIIAIFFNSDRVDLVFLSLTMDFPKLYLSTLYKIDISIHQAKFSLFQNWDGQ